MKLSADNRSLTLHVEGTLDALQVESLIRSLAKARGTMLPVVPDRRSDQDVGYEVLTEDLPSLEIAELRSGEFRIWFRNMGIGWIGVLLDHSRAIGFRDFLTTRLGPGVNLVNHDKAQRH